MPPRSRQSIYDLTPVQESQIRGWNAEGKTLTYCVQRFAELYPDENWPLHKLSRACKRIGMLWSGANPGIAAMAEREAAKRMLMRSELANAMLADAIALRERIWEQYTIVAATKNGLETVELDLPDAKAVSDFAKATESLVKSHANLSLLGEGQGRDLAASMLGRMIEATRAAFEAEGATGGDDAPAS